LLQDSAAAGESDKNEEEVLHGQGGMLRCGG
jgi:hypothetical protein